MFGKVTDTRINKLIKNNNNNNNLNFKKKLKKKFRFHLEVTPNANTFLHQQVKYK
jgi:hypothetical protein